MKKVCDFIARWMGAMVLLVAALALVVPASFVWIDTWAINPMLGVIMFGMGLTLSPQDFKIVLSRPKDILIGCLTQFTVMPLLAIGLTWAFALPKELAIGVILVGCCPGGTASNVITYLAKGDLALSVGMTAASTLLAPLLTPLLVWTLAGTMVDVDTMGMLMSIVYVVIAPIICGLLCQRFLPGVTKRVTPYLPAFSSVVIALVVGIVVSHNADRLLTAGLTDYRLHCGSAAPPAETQICGAQHRGGHAELGARFVAGRIAFRCLSVSHHSWSRIQRVAQHQRRVGS